MGFGTCGFKWFFRGEAVSNERDHLGDFIYSSWFEYPHFAGWWDDSGGVALLLTLFDGQAESRAMPAQRFLTSSSGMGVGATKGVLPVSESGDVPNLRVFAARWQMVGHPEK
jgi:hypothetical protein